MRNKLNSIQRMEVAYGRIAQSEILETVLQSDIDKIKMTLQVLIRIAFDWQWRRCSMRKGYIL